MMCDRGFGEHRVKPYRATAARRPAAWLFCLLYALQCGCSTLPLHKPETGHQTGLGKVAIVSPDREPEVRFQGLIGKTTGAGVGAGGTFATCMGSLGGGSCSGEICGAVLLFMLGVCGVAGVAGGIAGAVAAPGADAVRAAEAQRTELTAAVAGRTIQASLRDRVAAVALAEGTTLTSADSPPQSATAKTPDYRPLAEQGIDTVLEVALTGAGTQGPVTDAPVQVYMAAHVRLVRTRDNAEQFSGVLVYQGNRLKRAQWAADRGKPLLQALEEGYAALAAQIHDSVFRLYTFPDQHHHAPGLLTTAFGLAPVDPPLQHSWSLRNSGAEAHWLNGDPALVPAMKWPRVAGLQPTLRWQGFPRDSDRAAAPEDMRRVRDVRYDLVIAREHELAPAGIVYRRDGLPSPAHTLEQPLAHGTRYFWTVRARFELDGRERVTEWGTVSFLASEWLTPPSEFSYRFETP